MTKQTKGKKTEEFDSVEVKHGDLILEWEYIGEGLAGDYNAEDPNDQPLLRFSLLKAQNLDGEVIEDASFCTYMTTDTNPQILALAGMYIITEARKAIQRGGFRTRMEQLSHVNQSDFHSKYHNMPKYASI